MKQYLFICFLLFVTQLHSSQPSRRVIDTTTVCRHPCTRGFLHQEPIVYISHPGDEFELPTVKSDLPEPNSFQLRLLHSHDLGDMEEAVFDRDTQQFNITFTNEPQDPTIVNATIKTRKDKTDLTQTEISWLNFIIIEYLSTQRELCEVLKLINEQNKLLTEMHEGIRKANETCKRMNEKASRFDTSIQRLEEIHTHLEKRNETDTANAAIIDQILQKVKKPKSRWYDFCRTSTVKESPKRSPQQ